jgi:hypothetical protein
MSPKLTKIEGFNPKTNILGYKGGILKNCCRIPNGLLTHKNERIPTTTMKFGRPLNPALRAEKGGISKSNSADNLARNFR